MSLLWKNLYFFPVAQPLDLGLAVGDHRCCRMLSRSPWCNLQVMCAMRCNEQHRIIERIGHTSFGRVSSSEMLQRKRLQQTPRKKNQHITHHSKSLLTLPTSPGQTGHGVPCVAVCALNRGSGCSVQQLVEGRLDLLQLSIFVLEKAKRQKLKKRETSGKTWSLSATNSYYIICKCTDILFQMQRTNT